MANHIEISPDRIRISQRVIVTTSVMTIFSVPSPFIARLERLSITNIATIVPEGVSAALVRLFSLNGNASPPTLILSVEVPWNSTVVFKEGQLPRQATPTGFGVATNATPMYVDFTVTLE